MHKRFRRTIKTAYELSGSARLLESFQRAHRRLPSTRTLPSVRNSLSSDCTFRDPRCGRTSCSSRQWTARILAQMKSSLLVRDRARCDGCTFFPHHRVEPSRKRCGFPFLGQFARSRRVDRWPSRGCSSRGTLSSRWSRSRTRKSSVPKVAWASCEICWRNHGEDHAPVHGCEHHVISFAAYELRPAFPYLMLRSNIRFMPCPERSTRPHFASTSAMRRFRGD